MKGSIWIIIMLGLFPVVAFAQLGKGWSISSRLHTGYVTKHTRDLTIDNAGITEGFTMNLQYQTFGRKPWQVLQRYPKIGIQMGYFWMNNHHQLGSAIGIQPNLMIPFIRKESWQLKAEFGMGVAWLTKHYDAFSNPLNNAVGSNINNYTALGLFAEKKWKKNWILNTGLSLSHFSNGAAQLPNYGINIPAWVVGVEYVPIPLEKEDYQIISSDLVSRKWGFFAQATAARQESIGFDGPKYLTYNLAVALTYSTSLIHTSSIGIEYEYNYAVYNFYKFLEQYDEKETKNSGKRMMIFGGHEFGFGPVGLGGQIGFYIGPYRTSLQNFFYNKINLKYHFRPCGKEGVQPFIGLYMKAHLVEAEYIALGVGLKL